MERFGCLFDAQAAGRGEKFVQTVKIHDSCPLLIKWNNKSLLIRETDVKRNAEKGTKILLYLREIRKITACHRLGDSAEISRRVTDLFKKTE